MSFSPIAKAVMDAQQAVVDRELTRAAETRNRIHYDDFLHQRICDFEQRLKENDREPSAAEYVQYWKLQSPGYQSQQG